MNAIYLKQIILVLNISFISLAFAYTPTITGIFPSQGTDENGHISILGSNFDEVSQVLFNTQSGIIAVPQIVKFKDFIKVYFVPKDGVIAPVSVLGGFGIYSLNINFIAGIPSITGLYFSTDKEGRDYLILLGENLGFIQNCHFNSVNNERALGVFNFFGAYAQVYIPRNTNNGTISISGLSFGVAKTNFEFVNSTEHIPENMEPVRANFHDNTDFLKEILIYPNPSNGEFNIKTTNAESIQIFDISGKLIKDIAIKQEITKVSLSNKGLVLIRIYTKTGLKIFTAIVN